MNCQPTTYNGIKPLKKIDEKAELIETEILGMPINKYLAELQDEIPRTEDKPGPYEVRVNPKGRYYIHVTDNSHPLDDLLFRLEKMPDLKHLR